MVSTSVMKLKSVEAKPNHKVAVVWSAGQKATIDFSRTIQKGGVFAALSDFELFQKVRIGERNRTVEWPEPRDEFGYPIIDIDAESLFAMYSAQKDAALLQQIKSIFKTLVTKAKHAPEVT